MPVTTERIADHYEKLLVLRLVQVADAFCHDTPALSAETGFTGAWSAVETWPTGVLQSAARQPLLDSWVAMAERLVAAGVHRRYPGSHPSRHLRDFSRLALSWASEAPDGAAGQLQLLGRRSVPLVFGRAVLCTDTPTVDDELQWVVRGERLVISRADAGVIAEIDLAEPSRVTVTGPSWALVSPPSFHGILVDLRSTEYVGEYPPGRAGSDRVAAIQRALSTLDDRDLSVVTTYCRCITLRSRHGPWMAGLAVLPSPAETDLAALLLREAHRDRLMRWLTLNVPSLNSAAPASPLSDLRDVLADQGAARILDARQSGEGATAAPWEIVSNLIHEIMPAAPRDFTDAGLGSDPFGPATGSVLQLADLPSLDGRPAARLTLTKTRRGTYGDLDWSAVNELSRLRQDQLRELIPSLDLAPSNTEALAFYRALVSYLLGEWETCVRELQRCMERDNDVEEYWCLLGFARRHAGARDPFDRIVLSGDRTLDAETAR